MAKIHLSIRNPGVSGIKKTHLSKAESQGFYKQIKLVLFDFSVLIFFHYFSRHNSVF